MGLFSNIFSGGGNKSRTITFNRLPANLAELQAMPEARLADEFEVAALCVAALCNYESNPDATIEMLNYLRGPRPLSPMEVQFLRDRLRGKGYKPFSFFEGTSPANGYKASAPFSITISTNPYSYDNENMATLHLKSSGADSLRPVSLRKKPSTGQWFIWEITFLSDIRVPAAEDPWA